MLLHAPRWVFLDDAIAALDEDHRQLVLSIFERELAGAALVRLGRDAAPEGLWDRVLHIVELPGGPMPALRPAAGGPGGGSLRPPGPARARPPRAPPTAACLRTAAWRREERDDDGRGNAAQVPSEPA